jgi:hypothetical protein
VHRESRVAVPVARGYFENPERGTFVVGSWCQRTGDGTADWKDSVLI